MREVGLRSAGVFGNVKELWGCPRTRDVQLALGCFTWWRISLLFSIRPERSPIGQEISGCFFPGRERNTSPGGRLCHQDPVCFGEVLQQGKKKSMSLI